MNRLWQRIQNMAFAKLKLFCTYFYLQEREREEKKERQKERGREKETERERKMFQDFLWDI